MSNNKQTAVEWLQAEFNKWAEGRVFIPQDILEQAKQMEKEQTCTSNQVPFYEICYCNPKNGGSGICGCTISNKMVDGK